MVNPEGRDFHLRSYSPCIDAGDYIPDLTEDFEGDPRPQGSGYDMGADEFISDNSPPGTPTNVSPANEATDVSLIPTLRASAFSDPDVGDTHQASQCHVWASSTTWIIFSSTKSPGDLLSITIPPRILSDNITYSWCVRYQDNQGAWSDWSDPTEFTTEETGEVITVPGDCSTIQAAIGFAIYGEEIVVSPGRYVEKIDFRGKNIILRSTDPADPCVVASTIIDGSQAGSVVSFIGNEPSSCILSGFTITNGNASAGGGINGGGGIHGGGTLATIQNNIISGNRSQQCGGGIYGCDGTIENNIISGNLAEGTYVGSGGGLYACHGTIQKNLITGNCAIATRGGTWRGTGGGLAGCDGVIQDNIINNNFAEAGGGLIGCDGIIQRNAISGNSSGSHGGGLHQCHGTVQSNTICGNAAQGLGGGLYYCSGATIRNCIIWGNAAMRGGDQLDRSSWPTYSCIQGGTGGGVGNISADPLFADRNNGDYHLKSRVGRWDPSSQSWVQDYALSPCIDAGDPNSDWTEELWPHDKRINMGAYGGTPQASMSPSSIGNIADLNNDDKVDFGDLMLFTEKWLCDEVLLPEDLDRNGFVDFADYTIFADRWRH